MLPLLGGLGLTFILMYGKILAFFRTFIFKLGDFFKDLFSCGMCLGFWCGLLTGFLYYNTVIDIVLNAFSVSFLGFIFSTLIKFLEHLYTQQR